MKKYILILIMLLLATTITFGESSRSAEETVYVVMSSSSYAYHRTRSCSAVKKATHTVKEVTLSEALRMNRRPCKLCYKD